MARARLNTRSETNQSIKDPNRATHGQGEAVPSAATGEEQTLHHEVKHARGAESLNSGGENQGLESLAPSSHWTSARRALVRTRDEKTPKTEVRRSIERLTQFGDRLGSESEPRA